MNAHLKADSAPIQLAWLRASAKRVPVANLKSKQSALKCVAAARTGFLRQQIDFVANQDDRIRAADNLLQATPINWLLSTQQMSAP